MTALAFRRATDDDMHFVVTSFLDSTRATFTAGLIQMDDWWDTMLPQARKLFTRPGSSVVVAYKPGEDPPFDIYGWLATEGGHPWPVVVYTFVKKNFRKMGIARRLFAEAGINPAGPFRHATWMERELAAKVPRARWSPLTVRFERSKHVEGRPQRAARTGSDREHQVPHQRRSAGPERAA
jgi:hypothetical protein